MCAHQGEAIDFQSHPLFARQLSISCTIIQSHGGQITVEPNPGGGTTFRYTLRGVVPGKLNDGR